MENIKPAAVALLAGIIVLIGGWFLAPESVRDSLGSVASPIINSPYFGWGDVISHRAKTSSLNTASTTVCSLRGPAATSTLMDWMVRLDTSTTTATLVTISKAAGSATASPSASSTLLYNFEVAAGGQALIPFAPTTTTANLAKYVFTNYDHLVVTMQGGATAGTYNPTGVCQATWQAS
jgi:hypothetical protein